MDRSLSSLSVPLQKFDRTPFETPSLGVVRAVSALLDRPPGAVRFEYRGRRVAVAADGRGPASELQSDSERSVADGD